MKHVIGLELRTGERSVQRFAGNVVPERARLPIPHEEETVVQAAGLEMVQLAVHEGSQTDSRIARRSERHHPWLARHFALCDMVEHHFARDQGEPLASPLHHENGRVIVDHSLVERLAQ